MTDTRKPSTELLPVMRVSRLIEDMDGKRHYCVMQKMEASSDTPAGWRHVSRNYEHSTSAFAKLGRLMQSQIN